MSIDGVSTSIMQIEIPSDGLLPGCQHSHKRDIQSGSFLRPHDGGMSPVSGVSGDPLR